jgi:hypothetical protein
MYKIGTGDCFVLKFTTGTKRKFVMLIDCGSCEGDKNRFNEFVAEIGGFVDQHIDLLVVTHEHLDHIIGFARGQEEFKKIKIDHVWVAWTEEPGNNTADKLKEEYGVQAIALAAAVKKLDKNLNDPAFKALFKDALKGKFMLNSKQRFLSGLKDILSLHDAETQLGAAGLTEMGKAMKYVLKDLEAKNGEAPFYCFPGKAVPKLKGTDGIKFYVLGPPESVELIGKDEIKAEMYERSFAFRTEYSLSASLLNDSSSPKINSPFDEKYYAQDNETESFRKEYYDEPKKAWRKIDSDWLFHAGNVAIRLEDFINNTSLALAIEFESSGKVLLFPADAQSGNWISWHGNKMKWKIKKGNTTETIVAKDLLERTVFYKAGHHCSHNGTASKSGLDLMTSEELVAFLPLDYERIKPVWKNTMPGKGLYEELIKRTKGRLFRIDQGLVDEEGAKEERGKLSTTERNRFKTAHEITEHYIEFKVKA